MIKIIKKIIKEEIELLLKENKIGSLVNLLGIPKQAAFVIDEKLGKHSVLIMRWMIERMYNDGTNTTFPSMRYAERMLFASKKDLVVAAWSMEVCYQLMTAPDEEARQEVWEASDASKRFNRPSDEYAAYRLFKGEFEDALDQIIKGDDLFLALLSGKIQPQAFKNLKYMEARQKYAELKLPEYYNNTFLDLGNGYRWVDTQTHSCDAIGTKMRNCGSATRASFDDPDTTILLLVDGSNEPHVLATWQPNLKQLSDIQGKASTRPKEIYDEAILKLIQKLNPARLGLRSYNFDDQFISTVEKVMPNVKIV